jgi:hypothetical protein
LEKNGEYPAESHSSTGDRLAKRISKTTPCILFFCFSLPPPRKTHSLHMQQQNQNQRRRRASSSCV